MTYIHRGFSHPGGVSPMKQEKQKQEEEEKVEKKETIPNIVLDPKMKDAITAGQKQQDKQGVIKQGRPEQGTWDKTWEVLVNPMEAFAQYNKYGELKDNFSEDPEAVEGRSIDAVVDFVNPFGYIDMASDLGKSLDEDGFTKQNVAMIGLLAATQGKLKGKNAEKAIDIFNKLKGKIPKNILDKINKGIKSTKGLFKGTNKPKGGVDGNVAQSWAKGPRRLDSAGKEGITTQIQGMVNQGKHLDDMGYDASKMLNNKNVIFHGDPNKSGRIVVEVALPNGQTQLFYKSSGLAEKAGRGVGGTTEGMWQPFMGYSDEIPTGWVKNKAGDYVATGTAKAKNWHIKSPGYEDFYGSKSYRDIAGNLDRIAVEEGWNMTGQILKSTR